MRVYENPGRKPRWPDATPIGVRFRNGQTHTGKVSHYRWDPWPEGRHPFDVVEFWRG